MYNHIDTLWRGGGAVMALYITASKNNSKKLLFIQKSHIFLPPSLCIIVYQFITKKKPKQKQREQGYSSGRKLSATKSIRPVNSKVNLKCFYFITSLCWKPWVLFFSISSLWLWSQSCLVWPECISTHTEGRVWFWQFPLLPAPSKPHLLHPRSLGSQPRFV